MQVSATVGNGTGDGMDLSHSTSHVNAGQTARLISGHDANLIGAQVSGHAVVAEIGHNLTMRSPQDSSTYHSHDKQVGGSVTTGPAASVNARYSANTVNGDYASVRDQSGIQAGDGGFDVKVQGNTDLQGAVIASTPGAVSGGHNRLVTGTLTDEDISNHDHYNATGVSASAGMRTSNLFGSPSDGSSDPSGAETTAKTSADSDAQSKLSQSAGLDHRHGNDHSVTHSGISAGELTITDGAGQQAKTGESVKDAVAGIKRDVHSGDSANGLSKSWDGQALRKQVAAGAQITATVSQQAHEAISD